MSEQSLPEPSLPEPSPSAPERSERPVPPYVRQLAWFLDDAIPFVGGRRIGADGVLSFIPGVGDAAGFGLAAIVILAGVRAGVSAPTILRMVVSSAAESFVGMIPFLGPLISFAWKTNDRNLRLIEADLTDRATTSRSSTRVLLIALAITVVFGAILTIGLAAAVWGLWRLVAN